MFLKSGIFLLRHIAYITSGQVKTVTSVQGTAFHYGQLPEGSVVMLRARFSIVLHVKLVAASLVGKKP